MNWDKFNKTADAGWEALALLLAAPIMLVVWLLGATFTTIKCAIVARDSGSDPEGEDPSGAECEASQSGGDQPHRPNTVSCGGSGKL
jgi:hypothetical protein